MPKGNKSLVNLKSPLRLSLLLVQIVLIKIGKIPLILLYLIKDLLFFSLSLLFMSLTLLSFLFKNPRLHPWGVIVRFTGNILHLQRKRGRPRKLPTASLLAIKVKLFIKRKIPKSAKIAVSLAVILAVLFVYTKFILTAAYQLPSPYKLISPPQLTTSIYDRNGVLLYRLYEGKNRSLVKLEELPPFLIQATLAAEDKNFYQHKGIDLPAVIRAFYHNLKYNTQEGASTITQQLVKNALLTPEKTYSRKIKEILLSLWAESIYSKNEILQMYFNEAPYGGPAWGIKAASETYFDKEPKDLTLAESAFLAGLPVSPTQLSPYGTQPELGLNRQKEVLARMVELKYINAEKMQQALNEKLNFRPPQNNIKAPHFVFYIKDMLSQIYGPRVVSQGGLQIQTTLDYGLQKMVEQIVSAEVDNLSPLNVQNGAAMVTDSKTGQILAMAGSKDYFAPKFGNFNATLALRQPGSSIKVITYATAFKQGYSPGNTVLDTPAVFKDEWGNAYAPVNYDGVFHGPVSIRVALGSSLNMPAVKMLATIGVDQMMETARSLGITTFEDPKRYGLSLTLGGGEVKMIEMMGVYSAFAKEGRLNKPAGILKVADASGNTLLEYQREEQQVISPEIAYLISHILSDNNARSLAFGTNSLLNISGVAVKTGTSDNKRDNWTFGYTPDFTVGVWVGNNDNTPMDPKLTSGITGAAPIWQKITKNLLTVYPGKGFIQPSGIILANIDGRSDLAIAQNIPKGLVRLKNQDNKLIFSDAFSTFATSSAQAAKREGVTN